MYIYRAYGFNRLPLSTLTLTRNTLGQASLRARHSLRLPLCVGLAVVQTFAEFGMALAANMLRRSLSLRLRRNDNERARHDNGNAADDDIW